MKHIVKRGEPSRLRQWRLENKTAPQNLCYENIPKEAKDAVRIGLLKEQGGICAYTMWRIAAVEAGHIEHIHPQSRPPTSMQVSYANMVYCHPGEGAPTWPFGAHKKANAAVASDNFLSPLDRTCEARLRFRSNGEVEATAAPDAVARSTIDMLGLNQEILKHARAAAIRKLTIFRNRQTTASEARRQASRALERGRDGLFLEFAVAIRQAWLRYAEQAMAIEQALAKRAR